jgi:hypothetical protein
VSSWYLHQLLLFPWSSYVPPRLGCSNSSGYSHLALTLTSMYIWHTHTSCYYLRVSACIYTLHSSTIYVRIYMCVYVCVHYMFCRFILLMCVGIGTLYHNMTIWQLCDLCKFVCHSLDNTFNRTGKLCRPSWLHPIIRTPS